MEGITQKENVLFGYGPQRSCESSPSDMDMDFNDVFGGPPRRFSAQEVRMRHSFSDHMLYDEENKAVPRSSWPGLSEKPVFGAENSSRRRNQVDDFYDDIFRVDECYGSPRRSDRESFGSNPGSRVLSPSRPLPPKSDPFGTSLPAQFSLPAKMTKAKDLPVFASGSHSPHKKKDGSWNGIRNDVYRQSPLSREANSVGDELKYMSESDEYDVGGNLKKDGESVDSLSDEYQFHFSIYKWASKGVPILMSLKGGKHLTFKETIKTERSSRFSARTENNLPSAENVKVSRDANFHSFSIRSKNSKRVGSEYGIVGETVGIPKSKSLQNVNDATEEEVEEPQLRHKTGLVEEIQIEIPKSSDETKLKPLRAFLFSGEKEKGSVEKAQTTVKKSNMDNAMQAARLNAKVNENVKKIDDEVQRNLKKDDAKVSDHTQKNDSEIKRRVKKGLNMGSPLRSPLRSAENSTKAGIKGKVHDFVKMFNHEVHSTPSEGESRSKSTRWKASGTKGVESEKSFTMPKANEKVQLPTINKMQDATPKVNQNPNQQEKTTKYAQTKPPTPQAKDYSDQKAVPPINESKRDDRKFSIGNMDDLFDESFVVEELFEDQDKASEIKGKSEEIQASDAKIWQWSQGRKGNIRSLLSTLQFVLWPESGWKPVALVDLMEGSAVKRSYQRALLYLHPDKLQQKGAPPHHKYIAEKVFDILQEAWDHFNSLGSI